MASKESWKLPGFSTDSRERRIANNTRMIAATRISTESQFSHGCAGSCATPSAFQNELSGPAKNRFSRAVLQISASACINEFVKDFQDYRGTRYKQSQSRSGQV